MSKPPPIRSSDAALDVDGFETVKADINTLALAIAQPTTLYLGGPTRMQVPVPGIADVYLVSNLSTAGSTGVNYHIVRCLRSGQDSSGRKVDTRQAELPAYSIRFLGQFTVGQGDILALSLVVTGAPVPTLTLDNLTMRVDLTPS